MKNIESRVYRQRLIIEGHYTIDNINGETIRQYLDTLSKQVQMRIFSGPYSWPPDKWDKEDVELFELNGFVAWTESGCHIYAWRKYKFFTVDVYSCKIFDNLVVLQFTKNFFSSTDMIHLSI